MRRPYPPARPVARARALPRPAAPPAALFCLGVTVLWLLLALRAAAAPATPGRPVLLVHDGQQASQAKLAATVRPLMQPHAAAYTWKGLDVSTDEGAAFLRRYNLPLDDVPFLAVMDEPGPRAKVLRRIPLGAESPLDQNVRMIFSALRLPRPAGFDGAAVPAAGSAVAVIIADGGEAEKKLLIQAAGGQQIRDGVRRFEPGAQAIYRLQLPPSIRRADLRGELGGNYAVETAGSPNGPWTLLMDSYRYFAGLADSLRERSQPVADLSPVLKGLTGDLYLRVRSNARGDQRATLARLQVIALSQGQDSGESAWLLAAERLRKERLGDDGKTGTPLAGVVGDLTLKAAQSPYLLTGDLIVPHRRKLVIEPGVTVRVAGRCAIRVQGDVVAKGTRELPIIFIPLKPSDSDDWKGIDFAPLPGFPSGTASVLSHCRFVNADGIDLERFAGEVSWCVFENGLTGVTLRDGGTGRVHHNRFLQCRRGLVLDRGAGQVTENEWVDCLVGIHVQQPPDPALRLEKNSIAGCRIAAVTYLKTPGRTSPALVLPGNYWTGTPAERLIGGGSDAAEVTLEPRLADRPANVGPEASEPAPDAPKEAATVAATPMPLAAGK